MAGPIRITALADTGRATANIRGMGNEVGRVGARFGKLRAPAAALAGGLVLVGGGLLALAKGAAEDEKAQATLAQTLRNSAKATDAQVASVEDYITKMGAATGVTDDEMRPALGNLVRATGDVAKAQTLMGLAMDISAGTGKDLGAVSIALAKAQNGSVGGLAKLGIATKDASGKTKTFAQIQADLSKQFKGQSAAAANTLAGKYARVKLQLAEAGESIGAKLIPVLLVLANFLLTKVLPAAEKLGPTFVAMGQALGSVAKFVADNKKAFIALGIAIAAITAVVQIHGAVMAVQAAGGLLKYLASTKLITAATKTWTAVQWLMNIALTANPIGLVVVAIAALVALVILAYKHSDTFRKVVDKAFGAIKTAVVSVVNFFKALPGNIGKAVGDTSKLLLSKGKNLIIGFAKGYLSLWAGVGRFFINIPVSVLRWIGNTARTLVSKGANLIIGLHAGVISRVAAFARFIGSLAGSAARWVGNTISTLFSKGANLIIGFHQGVLSRVTGLARYIGGLGGSIGRWIGNLGRTLYNAGTQVIQGLIDGIRDKLPSLISTVSPIGGIIQYFKGPLSKDKRLLTPAGKSIIAGLIRGMDDELGTLQRFLQGASSMIESGLSPSPSVALAGTLATGTAAGAAPVVHVTVQTLAGGPEVGRVVADALDDYFRTNGPRAWSKA